MEKETEKEVEQEAKKKNKRSERMDKRKGRGHFPSFSPCFSYFSSFNLFLIGLIVFLGVTLFRFKQEFPPTIVTVNLVQLKKDFVLRTSRLKNLNDEELKSEGKAFLEHLNQTLIRISEGNRVVIFPKGAVLAGGKEITEQVRELMGEKGEKRVKLGSGEKEEERVSPFTDSSSSSSDMKEVKLRDVAHLLSKGKNTSFSPSSSSSSLSSSSSSASSYPPSSLSFFSPFSDEKREEQTDEKREERAGMEEKKEVLIYTKNGCPYCVYAKQFLEEKGIVYQEIELTQHPERFNDMVRMSKGRQTVPQVFLLGSFSKKEGDEPFSRTEHVGGYEDVVNWYFKNEGIRQ